MLHIHILIITKSEKRHLNIVRDHLIGPTFGRHLWPCGRHFAPPGPFHRTQCCGGPLSSPSGSLLPFSLPTLVRVGQRVLFRSEHSVLSRSCKECFVLSRSFFEFWRLMRPKRTEHSFRLFSKERKRT